MASEVDEVKAVRMALTSATSLTEEAHIRDLENAVSLRRIALCLERMIDAKGRLEITGEITAWKGEI